MSKKLYWLGISGSIAMVIVSVLIAAFCDQILDQLTVSLFFILGVLFGMLAALQIYIYADRKKP